uniref:Uncharacterized protein n=1 Tax=Stegastes partitus TaxID=144197 RepID=A0A3B4Z910_9TELE
SLFVTVAFPCSSAPTQSPCGDSPTILVSFDNLDMIGLLPEREHEKCPPCPRKAACVQILPPFDLEVVMKKNTGLC